MVLTIKIHRIRLAITIGQHGVRQAIAIQITNRNIDGGISTRTQNLPLNQIPLGYMVINEISRPAVGNDYLRFLITIKISHNQVASILSSRTNSRARNKLSFLVPEINSALLAVIGNGHIH